MELNQKSLEQIKDYLQKNKFTPIETPADFPKMFLYYEMNQQKYLIQVFDLRPFEKNRKSKCSDIHKIFNMLQHQFILNYRQYLVADDFGLFLFEYPENFLSSNMTMLDESVFYKLASALNFLHNTRNMHRDLRPEFIAFVDNQPKIILPCNVKEIIKETTPIMQSISPVGQYSAPECYTKIYTYPADVYSLGKVFSKILEKLPRCDHKKQYETLINKMLNKNEKCRPKSSEVHTDIAKIQNISYSKENITIQELGEEKNHMPSSFVDKHKNLLYKFLNTSKTSGNANVYFLADPITERLYCLKVNQSIQKNDYLYLYEEMINTLKCRGPSVVSVVDYDFKENYDKGDFPWLLLDYIPSLSLDNFTKIIRDDEDPKCFKILYGIAKAMDHITKICYHRDLSPGNIVVNQYFEPFIIDFGESISLESSEKSSEKSSNQEQAQKAPQYIVQSINENYSKGSNRMKGTSNIMAPETQSEDRRKYTPTSDVYSYGKSLQYVVEDIWKSGSNHNDMIFKAGCPEFLRNLIEKCTQKEPSQRPTFSQICDEIDKHIASKDKEKFKEYYIYREYLDVKYNEMMQNDDDENTSQRNPNIDYHEFIKKLGEQNIQGNYTNYVNHLNAIWLNLGKPDK